MFIDITLLCLNHPNVSESGDINIFINHIPLECVFYHAIMFLNLYSILKSDMFRALPERSVV